MNRPEMINNELNYFSQHPRCFTAQELINFAAEELDLMETRNSLLSDPRFLHIPCKPPCDEYYISKQILIRGFAFLNLRLGQANQSRLEEKNLLGYMNSHGIIKNTLSLPEVVVRFANQFGLISPLEYVDIYVFPLAKILSFLSDKKFRNVSGIIDESINNLDIEIDNIMAETVDKELKKLEQNMSYVLRAREGFFQRTPFTLKVIAQKLGYTRERIRQIQIEAMQMRYLVRPFFSVLLWDIIHNHGSLLSYSDTKTTKYRKFIVKCLGIPYVEFQDMGLTILGFNKKDLPNFQPPSFYANKLSVLEWLKSDCKLDLVQKDLEILTDHLILYWLKKTTITKKLHFTLHEMGRPSHYSEICKVYNSLFPDYYRSEENVHAALGREEHGVVWIGAKGMYALEEWGYKHPSIPLFNTVTEIVTKKYKITKKPVPLEVIVSELGK